MRAAPWVALLLALGCKPKYPNCETDKDCRKGEFCVGKRCQQCRGDADCERGQACVSGRCDPIEGWCETAADCPDNQGCRDNRCVPCETDSECGGGTCRDGRCLPPGECVTDDDCPLGHECQMGRCRAPPPEESSTDGPCELEPIYFGFDESVLSEQATEALAANVECLRIAGERSVRVEGHCDPRGTEEYNLALGDRRARAAVTYLTRAGVQTQRLRPVSKGKIESRGTSEASWALDRRVELIWE